MSEPTNLPPELADNDVEPLRRCPHCDTVVNREATQCLMCGSLLPVAPPSPPETLSQPQQPDPAVRTPPEVKSPRAGIEEKTRVRPALPTIAFPKAAVPKVALYKDALPKDALPTLSGDWQTWVRRGLTAFFMVIILLAGTLILRFQSPTAAVALFPTMTSIPPTLTATPTWTPWPTETPRPSATATITMTPAPSDTPEPPRSHGVASGDTLIGLSLRYRVSPDSIASANGFNVESPIQIGQTLLIPWPTPTPPLVPVAVEIRGEVVIADPTDCQRYEVQLGDSISAIAARFDVDFTLFMRVNRLTEDVILQRGDTLCIPEIVYGGSLPPTPGPTPTPSPTRLLPGPSLLYPVNGMSLEPPDSTFLLQWVAVKDLGAEEWYMVEVRNLDDVDQPPYRGFTRDTAFRVPQTWRPWVAALQNFRWRVSIVQVTAQRIDGQFIYTFGGETSEEAFFYWLGAIPTPTATPTPMPAVMPEP